MNKLAEKQFSREEKKKKKEKKKASEQIRQLSR